MSERGTLARSVLVYRADDGILEIGDWLLSATNPDGEGVELWATVGDDVSGFGGGARFVTWVDRLATVASPATADLAIAVGSYSTRPSFGGDRVGQLSGFSGRGWRIDGTAMVDVVAPGDYDVLWAQSRRERDDWGLYSMGSGTSAAGPHVAGAVVLLRQARPDATPAEIEAALRAGALVDDFVGATPNAEWGAGKLRIPTALDALGPAPRPRPIRTPASTPASPDAAPPARRRRARRDDGRGRGRGVARQTRAAAAARAARRGRAGGGPMALVALVTRRSRARRS